MKPFIFTGETLTEARDFLVSCGDKKYRADQVLRWIYEKNIFDFDEMTNLPKALASLLKSRAETVSVAVCGKKTSKKNKTIKYLFKLNDGNCIESVFLPYNKRNTACISVQVGCPLGCAFCATGRQGFIRNLTTDEIVGQFLQINRDAVMNKAGGVSNIVLMGMGEPFLNYNNVIKALDILSEPWGAGISHRRITVSTSGVVAGMDRLSAEKKHYNLSISLHSPFSEKRKQLIPLNKKYSLRRLMDASERYIEKTKTMITFQYLLIGGFNDTVSDARELTVLLKGLKCKINIIVYNKISGLPFKKPTEKAMERFISILTSSGITTTRRKSMGEDIDSGCGQLRQRYSAR